MSHPLQYNCLTQLKNADLAALSAKEAITHLLGYKALTGLKRYTLWEIFFKAGTSPETAKEAVMKCCNESYILINPNKEQVFDTFPKSSPDMVTLRCRVTPKEHPDLSDKEKRFESLTHQSCGAIRKAIVWELQITPEPSQSIEELRQKAETIVIKSQSIKEGLLVNPVYETFTWLDEGANAG